MRIKPEDCDSMAMLRRGIDAVDADLLDLLAARSRYIDRAAQLKARERLPARIDDRVEQVVANARRGAATRDLDPELAEVLWREIVEWSIRQEIAALAENPSRD